MFKTKTAFKGYIQNPMFELEEAWIYKEIWSEITTLYLTQQAEQKKTEELEGGGGLLY